MEIKRCYDTLVGASVAENQLVGARTRSITVNGVTVTENGDGSITLNGTSTSSGLLDSLPTMMQTVNHVYYLAVSGSSMRLGYSSIGGNAAFTQTIKRSIASGTTSVGVRSDANVTYNDLTIGIVCIDLTAYFGSTIADYLYSLESATAGSGIAWLRSYDLITDEYKPYNTGTIESVEATAKVVRDENGENAITYPLGSDVLRGIFKLDANNNLYADGDRKEADGTITRKYGVVDLGTLNWSNGGQLKLFFSTGLKELIKKASTNAETADWIKTVKFDPISYDGITGSTPNRICISAAGSVGICDGNQYESIADFKAAMSGVMLVYELATPTTEQSTPFTSPQIVYPDGTEEFVTENGVPVGHETRYEL